MSIPLESYFVFEAARKAAESQALNKADTGDMANMAVESLGRPAHVSTWRHDSPTFGATLRMIPVVPALQVDHKEPYIDDWGFSDETMGAVAESGSPRSLNPNFGRQEHYVKPFAEAVRTTSMAEFTQLVGDQLGNATSTQMAEYGAMARLIRNRSLRLLHWDTRYTADTEANALLPSGLFQQIEVETAGTYDEGALGNSQIIDLAGGLLDADVIAHHLTQISQLRGQMPSVVSLPPTAYNDLGRQLNPSYRGQFGQTAVLYGNQVVGIHVMGQNIPLIPDAHLSWEQAFPLYAAPTLSGAMAAPSAVTAVAGAVSGSEVSKWTAADDGEIFYVVRAMSAEGQLGTGKRTGSADTDFTAVAAGQKVTVTITPSDANAKCFFVYRGKDDGSGTQAATRAALIGVVAASGASVVTFTDLNTHIPKTDRALALPISGPVYGEMARLLGQSMNLSGFIQFMQSQFTTMSEMAQLGMNPANFMGAGVKRSVLGPSIIRVEQGKLGLQARNDVIGQVTAIHTPGAKLCLGFTNIGRGGGV